LYANRTHIETVLPLLFFKLQFGQGLFHPTEEKAIII
jgi:hypothetical protein